MTACLDRSAQTLRLVTLVRIEEEIYAQKYNPRNDHYLFGVTQAEYQNT